MRRFSACDPLASASTICTDITGILTENQMKVCISLGEELIEACRIRWLKMFNYYSAKGLV